MAKHQTLKRVLIMAGGTGGHIFPGLAVANYLREKNIEVEWLGTSHGLESQLVKEAGFPLHLIEISGIRGKGIKTLINAPFRISAAVLQSMKLIKHLNPDVVLGMGGFVSGPGGIASWMASRPLIIHEQNAKAGITNKILATVATRILEGFPSTFTPGKKVISIGNPVRSQIENLPPPQNRFAERASQLHLLILGGSLGAKAINEVVPYAMASMKPTERPQIIHQTGTKHFEEVKKVYESLGVEVNLKPFIQNMAEAYSWADVVLCRSGALTIAELCAVGLGAILIPFPHAVDDHQTANANFMVNNKAALCIQQTQFSAERLINSLKEVFYAPEKRLAMAEAAYQLRKVNVAERIFDIIKEVVS